MESGIGDYEGAGSGGGWMDFSFGVDDIVAAETALTWAISRLQHYNVPPNNYHLNVFQGFDEICYDLPPFVEGDCLTFQFEDNDYGALIILQVGRGIIKPSAQDGLSVYPSETQILVGVINYKEVYPPQTLVFENREWLIAKNQPRQGQPYLIWLKCYGDVEFKRIGFVTLNEDDQMSCQFMYWWENLLSNVLKELINENIQSETPSKKILEPLFPVGSGLLFTFDDGDYGAIIVLDFSTGIRPTHDKVLLGVLDYKEAIPPTQADFNQRNWLKSTQGWRTGQPFLMWAISKPKFTNVQQVTIVEIRDDDPKTCQFGLMWDDIPDFFLQQSRSS
ncbi:MAG: hypothetical protein AAF846_17975 [Chloroflexota bacterium]